MIKSSSVGVIAAILEVDSESDLLMGAPGDHLLNVTNSDLFYGGIPPSIDLDVYRKASG